MTTISHVWPGYTLLNVWGLTFKDWVYLRTAADQYDRDAKAANRG